MQKQITLVRTDVELLFQYLTGVEFDFDRCDSACWEVLDFSMIDLLKCGKATPTTVEIITPMLESMNRALVRHSLISMSSQSLEFVDKLAICMLAYCKYLLWHDKCNDPVLYRSYVLKVVVLCPANLKNIPVFCSL